MQHQRHLGEFENHTLMDDIFHLEICRSTCQECPSFKSLLVKIITVQDLTELRLNMQG